MTGKTKITMQILTQESPFFIPEVAEKYGWNEKTLWGFIHSYKNYPHFEISLRESDGSPGKPGKIYKVLVDKSETNNK